MDFPIGETSQLIGEWNLGRLPPFLGRRTLTLYMVFTSSLLTRMAIKRAEVDLLEPFMCTSCLYSQIPLWKWIRPKRCLVGHIPG